MSPDEPPKPKYNTLQELNYFRNKFFQTYGTAHELNPGRDIKIMKRVKQLFEEHNSELGDLRPFIDWMFEHNKDFPIGTPALLGATNKKLGGTSKEKKENKEEELPTWVESERQKWNNKLQ